MSISEAHMHVSYSQIAVFDPMLENPFNDRNRQQVAEGGSSSTGSVSFKTPVEEGDALIRVHFDVQARCGRTQVIEITGNGGIEVATITESFPIDLPNGEYEIGFFQRADR